MEKYQAAVGHKLFIADAYTMANAKEIKGATETPQKGGQPEDISLNHIDKNYVLHVNGQQDLEQMVFSFSPDFTAETGNLAVLGEAYASETAKWFYEEYTEGTDTTSGSTTTHTMGAGVLWKAEITGINPGGQSGNSAQAAEFYLNVVSDGFYLCSGGDSPTYKSIQNKFRTVTTPV